ncbi:restriction endonuclease subunit S [uncultured Endozoicomonas sp.]|uniref:restriction endonuclease subunit S n=1 Tax=uncultured Endozoicomonas sp. TaxID=432652 RepID=UPI0026161E19|nr:restriction endonuclease subunit S [uncultured Endozoicomonas sp.]
MEWPCVALGEVCSFENGDRGKNYPSRAKFVQAGIPFVNAGHLDNGQVQMEDMNYISRDNYDLLSRGKFSAGDILFCLRGSLGKHALVKKLDEGAIASSLVIIRTSEKLDAGYFQLYLQSALCAEMIKKYEGGAAQPNLGAKDLAKFSIPLPELEEQKRIVTLLDKAFAEIEQARALAEKNLNNTRELFESYLQQVFSPRGEGWIESTIGDLGKVSMCKRILKKQTASSGDIPFYKIGTFGKEPNSYIDKNIYREFKKKYSFPKKGDVLISASGTIGRRVIYDGKPAYFQDSNIVWIANNEELALNKYLYHFYGFCDWNPSKGATISRLYNDDLRKIKIAFPSTRTQKIIVENIENLETQVRYLKEKYEQKLIRLSELKKSILQKAFTGQLTSKEVA